MAYKPKKVKVSGVVVAGAELKDEFIPKSGKIFWVQRFFGQAPFNGLAYIYAVWDEGGSEETMIWSTHGSDDSAIALKVTGDGVKKLEIIGKNNHATKSFHLSGLLSFKRRG